MCCWLEGCTAHSYLATYIVGTLPAAVGGGKVVHFMHSVSLETQASKQS